MNTDIKYKKYTKQSLLIFEEKVTLVTFCPLNEVDFFCYN